MEERKEAVLYKFEKPGDKLEGHLAGIVKTQIEGKGAVDLYFSVREKTDQFVKVHATIKMLEKIRSGDVGRKMRIQYMGENTKVKTQGNPMREFAVAVDVDTPPRTDLLMESSLAQDFD